MSNRIPLLLVLFVIFAFCLSDKGVYAFGAGNIPSFAYMEGRAFRHGDIEDTLSELVKKGAAGGFGLAALISKGTKFGGLDVKRVYFGNWLRDYIDIGALKKVNIQTIINLCMVLGFMAHGYVTEEFEVTEERLGCYLPTEHIDNPKGYGMAKTPANTIPTSMRHSAFSDKWRVSCSCIHWRISPRIPTSASFHLYRWGTARYLFTSGDGVRVQAPGGGG
ncbi:heterokaryon incompatibility protein Het-C-domain-containing protein [Pisolithus marmoratus]|nr:heterokaryon incompatibility protein Het-C-domain-containing protein [Pisolithus marmoratus]